MLPNLKTPVTTYEKISKNIFSILGARIALSERRLAAGLTNRGFEPNREINFLTSPERPQAYLASCKRDIRCLSRGGGGEGSKRSRALATHSNLRPKLRMSRAIPLFPPTPPHPNTPCFPAFFYQQMPEFCEE